MKGDIKMTLEEKDIELLGRLLGEDGVKVVTEDHLGRLGEDMLEALGETLERYEDVQAEMDYKENVIEAMEKHIKESEEELDDLSVVYTKWETKKDRL